MQMSGVSGFGEVRNSAVQYATTEARDVEATKDSTEAAKQGGIAFKGDTVNITDQAKKLATKSTTAGGDSADSTEEQEDSTIKIIKDRINQLKEEIRELQDSTMNEKEKQQQILALNQELMTQTTALQKLQEQGGISGRYGKGGLDFSMSANMG